MAHICAQIEIYVVCGLFYIVFKLQIIFGVFGSSVEFNQSSKRHVN